MKHQAMKLLILEKNPADWHDFEKDSRNTAYPFQITLVSTLRRSKDQIKTVSISLRDIRFFIARWHLHGNNSGFERNTHDYND